MLFVSASDLSESDLAALGNNIRPATRPQRRSPNAKANQRVLAAVNRSLAGLEERVSRLHPRRDGLGITRPMPIPVS